MARLPVIAATALAISLSGCGTTLVHHNGDVNWKAVGATVLTGVATVLIVNELGGVEVNGRQDVYTHTGEVKVSIDKNKLDDFANWYETNKGKY